MRRLDQKFGIGPEMQRIVVAADDLTGDTGRRAELLRRAIGVGAGGRMDRARGRPGRIGPGPEDVIVPPRSKGGSPVARRNIDSDYLRGGSLNRVLVELVDSSSA